MPIVPGCALGIGPALASVLVFSDPSGFAFQAVPLPVAPDLRGLSIFAQGGVLDPGAGSLGVSQVLAITVGD